MPKIENVEYNDTLWGIAHKLLIMDFASLVRANPSITQIILPPASIVRKYKVLVKRLKAKFKMAGVPFDERNFIENDEVPIGSQVTFIHIHIVPNVRKRWKRQ